MMVTDRLVQIVFIVGALLLVLRGLSRTSIGKLIGMAAIWTAILFGGFLLFANREALGPELASLRDRFDPATPDVIGETVRVPMSPDGHFWVRGTVNGHRTRFLIDSGATTTALSEATVDAAGLTAKHELMPVIVSTGNGTVRADRVTIDRLAIGPIRAEDFEAITAPGFGGMNVLGMNFLSGLKSWSVEGRTMVLRPKAAKAPAGTREDFT